MANEYRRLFLTLVLLACAVGYGVTRLRSSRGFDEDEFRDTSGLAVTNVTWSKSARGYMVRAQLNNQRNRAATSVVLFGEVHGAGGELLASNPLINVLDVRPSTARTFDAIIPAPSTQSEAKVSLKVVVVRWEEEL
jgi:hypothetical protein